MDTYDKNLKKGNKISCARLVILGYKWRVKRKEKRPDQAPLRLVDMKFPHFFA